MCPRHYHINTGHTRQRQSVYDPEGEQVGTLYGINYGFYRVYHKKLQTYILVPSLYRCCDKKGIKVPNACGPTCLPQCPEPSPGVPMTYEYHNTKCCQDTAKIQAQVNEFNTLRSKRYLGSETALPHFGNCVDDWGKPTRCRSEPSIHPSQWSNYSAGYLSPDDKSRGYQYRAYNSGYLSRGDISRGYRSRGENSGGYLSPGDISRGYQSQGENSGSRNTKNVHSGSRNTRSVHSGNVNSERYQSSGPRSVNVNSEIYGYPGKSSHSGMKKKNSNIRKNRSSSCNFNSSHLTVNGCDNLVFMNGRSQLRSRNKSPSTNPNKRSVVDNQEVSVRRDTFRNIITPSYGQVSPKSCNKSRYF